MPPTLSIKKETNIKGLPHGVSADEEDALWGDCPFLRPKDHRRWLEHFVALEFGLARLLAGWIPGCGHLDWKIELPRLLFEHMQRARRLRERLEELPGGKGAIQPSPVLAHFLRELARADSGRGFVQALVSRVLPALARAYAAYIERSDEVFDAPTLYLLRINRADAEESAAWARRFLDVHPLIIDQPDEAERYRRFVEELLPTTGDLLPPPPEAAAPALASPVANPPGPNPQKRCNDPRLRLRVGFPTTKEGNPTSGTLREIVYHNATEWQVIDPMCEIFHALPNMPMDFFVDFARHIWDECRHARMGIRRLTELGYTLDDFEWTHGAERVSVFEDFFAGLTMIGEACSFTRKKGSIPFFLRHGDRRSAMLPEVDCVDEQLHVGYGHRWLTEIFQRAAGQKRTRDDVTVERRRAHFQHLLQSKDATNAKALLEQLDEKSRDELVNSFSGFCGLIEFKLDFTVY